MELTSLQQITALALQKGKKRLVLAAAEDMHALGAAMAASRAGLIEPILIGDGEKISRLAGDLGVNAKAHQIVEEKKPADAARLAVGFVSRGEAEIIMKGLLPTSAYMKAILDKEAGLLKGGLLSHLALFESPMYHKLLAITDVAINIRPTLAEKAHIINNACSLMHRLGYDKPLAALLAPLETVNEKIESTVHAALLAQMNRRGQIQGCLLDGPLALDNIVSAESAKHKGIVSEVAGNADIIIANDLDSGNALYKCLSFLGGATSAAVVLGARVPIVLTSRADSEASKLASIALSVCLT